MRGARGSGGMGVRIYVPCNQQAFEKGDLKQPETKKAEQVLPSLEVCTFTKGKKCYSLNAATEQVDHSGCELIVIVLQRSA